MSTATSSFASFVEAVLCVVGELPELGEITLGAAIERREVRALSALPPTTATIVVDLRTVPFDDLVAWREAGRERTPPAPLVLVCDRLLGEDAIDGVRADDLVVLPRDGARALARRLRAAIALGRSRLAVSLAEQILAEADQAVSVLDTSRDGAPFVAVSSRFARLAGYERRDVEERPFRTLQNGDVTQAGAAALEEAFRKREHGSALVRSYRKDGSMFWNEVTVLPVTFGESPTRWAAALHHDVTALVEARSQIGSLYQRLVDQRTFDQAILDGIEVGIITTDRGGNVLFTNRAAMLLLGASVAAGAQVADVFHLPCLPDALLEREPRWTARHTVVTPDGEVELDIELSRADGSNDGNIGFFVIFRDSREERQRAEEHRRFERLAALGTMVAGFAHEVRNPVAALRSIAEELGEELTQAGLRLPHAGRMLRVLERMERLVRSSLRFGRPDVPKRSSHRPWMLCSAALTALSPRLHGAELRIEMDYDLPSVFVDDGQIVQALVVLIDNALDAVGSPDGVSLRVYGPRAPDSERPRTTLPVTSSMVRFEVSDVGPGISATDLPRIFDPFFTTKASGTGLGLSIAQQLVSENGGRIEVSSGRGSTVFTVFVPTSDPRTVAAVAPEHVLGGPGSA